MKILSFNLDPTQRKGPCDASLNNQKPAMMLVKLQHAQPIQLADNHYTKLDLAGHLFSKRFKMIVIS